MFSLVSMVFFFFFFIIASSNGWRNIILRMSCLGMALWAMFETLVQNGFILNV